MRSLSISTLLFIFLSSSISFLNAQCTDCDDLMCLDCDPSDLVNGLSGTLSDCGSCPVQPNQPTPLCDAAGQVPQNMFWVAFVASAEEHTIQIEILNCVNGQGLQAGVYDDCSDDSCVAFSGGCTNNATLQMDLFDLAPGEVYHLFLDGCNGEVCDFIITIEDLEELILPEIDAVTAYSPCADESLTDNFNDPSNPSNASISGNCSATSSITVCPGSGLDFSLIHQDACGQYSDNMDAELHWSTTWAGDFVHNPSIDGEGLLPPLNMPSDEGVYTICIDFIETECSSVIGPVCLDIHVVNAPLETYEYQVCIEDLDGSNGDGWNPAEAGDDPNGDGLGWQGESVTLDEVDAWPENNEGYNCMTFTFLDPDCNCPIDQELCIRPIGNRQETPLDLYMFRSQFEECDAMNPLNCSDEDYEWIWDWNDFEEIFELDTFTQSLTVIIPGYSMEQEDWSGENTSCDTLISVSVFVTDPPIELENLGCGAYFAKLDSVAYYENNSVYENFPPIINDSVSVTYITCNDGLPIAVQMNDAVQIPLGLDSFCISMSYLHIDGAWWDPEEEMHTHGSGNVPLVTTETIYGPYGVASAGIVNPPVVSGDDTFCSSDLSDHVFQIVNPTPSFLYTWNSDPVIPGVTVTDISIASDGSIVIIDLPDGWNPSDCISVVAQSACGTSAPTFVCFNILTVPSVSLDPILDICASSAPDSQAITVANVSATVSPVGNYDYTWNIDGNVFTTTTGNTSYSAALPGTSAVSVSVVDNSTGCSSVVSVMETINIIPPLDTPLLTCSDVGPDYIEICWAEVPGAIGYEIFISGAVVEQVASTSTCYFVTGLAPFETIEFTLVALGTAPCFDSAPAIQSCVTSDCGPSDIIQLAFGETYCVNESLGILDLNQFFSFTNPNGALSFSSNPPNLVGADGLFDTEGLAPGSYNISVTYTYDVLCLPTVFNLEYIVLSETEAPCVTTVIDNDGDGSPAGEDCDDNDANNYPGNTEICDGVDNNCNGQIDENLATVSYFLDADGDGYGDNNNLIIDCTQPTGYIANNMDCNDNDPNINPGAIDIPNNGIDENCDGILLVIDNDGDGFNSDEDCNDGNPDVFPGNVESCDGLDNNCNGQVDENITFQDYYYDGDSDGYGTTEFVVNDCRAPQGYVLDGTDCNDADASINPGTIDIPNNGIDENCDGVILVIDEDGDGYNSDEDCDDSDPDNFPGNQEVCDGRDNNCDGQVDENLTFQDYYLDSDNDGYGTIDSIINDCVVPQGYVIDNTDCDDTNATVYPGNEELCDNLDNNCNGEVNENLAFQDYFLDADGDGYGVSDSLVNACAQPLGYVIDATDCDDTNAEIYPGAVEILGNGIDENCDGADEPSSTAELGGYKILLFPNPVKDFLILETELIQLSYSLYSVNGLHIDSARVEDGQIDLSDYSSGVYLIKITQPNYESFVIQKVMKL